MSLRHPQQRRGVGIAFLDSTTLRPLTGGASSRPNRQRETSNKVVIGVLLALLAGLASGWKMYIHHSVDDTGNHALPYEGTIESQMRSSAGGDSSSSLPLLADPATEIDHVHPPPPQKECTIWIAPSSLKGNPGYGIFTTRDIHKGESVLGGPDGVSIPITNAFRQVDHEKKKWLDVWENYWWIRGVPDHVTYEGGKSTVVDYQVSFGAMPNHHCLLDSLDPRYPNPPYDDTLANRFDNPGAGAFTYGMGRDFFVTRSLRAGDELFLQYGYCKRDDDIPDWAGLSLMPSDFKEAADIIWDGGIRFDSSGDHPIFPKGTSDLVVSLLPKTKKEYKKLKKAVSSKKKLPKYLAKHKGLNRRSPEWIRDHGMCLEHLTPRKSTLPHAGQGGFAQHMIRAGEMVAPAPLLQVMDQEVLAVRDRGNKPIGFQLVLNYCFGHPQSTLLLCPDSNAVLINHCSDRTKECGSRGPNAEYRWSSGWDPTSDAWRKMSLEDMAKEPGRGLAFEFIALRDIHPGEEVFIDYGIEWENAWKKHVAGWKPALSASAGSQETTPWVSAKEANSDGGAPILEALVSGDLRTDMRASHPYLFTGCQYWVTSGDNDPNYQYDDAVKKSWEDLDDEAILDLYADDGSEFVYQHSKNGYATHGDKTHWPCSILFREKTIKSSHKKGKDKHDRETYRYTVRIHQSLPWREKDMPWEKNHLPRILTGYPRESIHYFVKPNKSDQHLEGVFRNPIGIRDEMFPEQWKNRKNDDST